MERGFYDNQIARLLSLFAREHAYFFRTDCLFADGSTELAKIFAFLGVSNSAVAGGYVTPVKAGAPVTMPLEDRRMLEALYAPQYTRLEELTGLDLSDWRDPAYVEPMAPD